MHVVVIGSSAGGIEALSRVVAGLPGDLPASVVIAQHLDPRRPSHLAEILARFSTMPIKVIEAGSELEDGVIHVVPSNQLVEIVKGRLHLRPARPGKVAPSVDLLLETAARAFGAGVVAVILTGTGTDGSAGAWHVKQQGGAVLIENPATAMFPSMPASVSPSLVDAKADLESIGNMVRDMVLAGTATPSPDEEDEVASLLERVRERSGIDFGSYKTATIRRRLLGRMHATAQATVAAYARLVERDPDEYARLVGSLLIKVTQFFRDPKVFQELRERTLPDLIAEARREGRELRVWSAGCSSGEEAYSIAITLAEALGDQPVGVRLFATDVDAAAIAFARRGLYPPGALANVPAAMRDRYFVKTEEGYEVARRLRTLVIFGEHDLGARAPFPRIDLILCRNVLIYFTPAMQRVVLETFAYSLRPAGRLVLGPSESVTAWPDPFVEEHGRLRVYRRVPGAQPSLQSRFATAQLGPAPAAPDVPDRPARSLQPPDDTPALATESPVLGLRIGVVVVNADYDIVLINAAARRALGIHGVAFDQDFIHLAESLPSAQLRSLIDAALQGDLSSAIFEVSAGADGGDAWRFIDAFVHPHMGAGGSVKGALIELTDVSPVHREQVAHGRTTRQFEWVTALNQRLLRANEELTEVVVALRAANQAMVQTSQESRAGREEVETLNEEFQATNEELETLNEELTASVEELRIANDDLAERTEELRVQAIQLEQQRRHSDEEHDRLESILSSLGDAVVAVDRDGSTVATNVAYDRLFGGPGAEIEPEDLAGLPLPREDWPNQRAARGERFRMEFAVRTPDGTRRWLEAVAEPLSAEDRTWRGVVAIRDVSERTMRLSLERLMAAAGHELKTPTAAIHNYLQIVTRRLEAGNLRDSRKYAARALEQTRRLGHLIERLFDTARIRSGQLELLNAPVDLVALTREVVQTAEVLPGAPPIVFSPGQRTLRVHGDAGRLSQVLLNLTANAIEHAPGSASVDVAVRRSGRRALIEVRDHGEGIPPESLPNLFEPYARLGQARRRTGLGLGLFIAREIVTAHGGRLEVSSRVGEGTTVTVQLPLRPTPPVGQAGASTPVA